MIRDCLNTLLISDFNIQTLAGYLENDSMSPSVKATVSSYGQVMPILINRNQECWNKSYDSAIVWTRPEGVIDSYRRCIEFERVPEETVLKETDSFAEAVLSLQDRVQSILIPTWTEPQGMVGYGMLNMKPGLGLSHLLMRMNLRLAEKLDASPQVHVLDANRWNVTSEEDPYNPKLWYMGKIGYSNQVFKAAASDIKAALRGIQGEAKKIIIVDLDNTLWGGIVGDDGWQNLRLGGHDPEGEAFADFQKALKGYSKRGILLAVVSKNEESIALEAIDNHPEMVLGRSDFVGWRINWSDKAQNILDLLEELKLGTQSAVFIDDNTAERERVRQALPDVLVPEWPENPLLYKQTFLRLTCFDTSVFSDEDAKRKKMYHTEKQRESLRVSLGSMEEWLTSLDIEINIEELSPANHQRTAQLLNKTNQMNLSTRRMTEAELVQWTKKNGRRLWTLRVSDKFGDSGLTGIVALEHDGNAATIVDFVLSCRVMGRKVEETMVYHIIEWARAENLHEVVARFLPTAKNKPCHRFWMNSGFKHNTSNESFTWDLQQPYPKPEGIRIKGSTF
ncbi:MAG: HAD-IIIC family phosphatase [Nitrospinae bacterium]|nr:HAD-IIIC family phosphatase [Nitrospinota bacterium]